MSLKANKYRAFELFKHRSCYQITYLGHITISVVTSFKSRYDNLYLQNGFITMYFDELHEHIWEYSMSWVTTETYNQDIKIIEYIKDIFHDILGTSRYWVYFGEMILVVC